MSNITSKLVQGINYIYWKRYFESFLSGQGLLGFVNGLLPQPMATIYVPNINGETNEVPNPNYQAWVRSHQIVQSWLVI